ncbi:MAG: ABC transporter, fused permease protein [uncultured Thermomicrobiales bacterium]|uniref:ABC transporter, fused permease protein n=1 Tax=uncultured Thermomicrobiales bacterium TaxID=1645740 RepID=A0A6J4UZC8_9BACT|nr:MAG: ABC transporter, fused permease protein [uncultured Thermomicrobiales bacterium]
MNAAFYTNYTTRSLRRGGQRTLLALFCVAVGVMAIVGLQLVGGMIRDALVGNARVLNGGDLSARSFASPFSPNDLAPFDELKRRGIITEYTAALEDGAQVVRPDGRRVLAQMRVVDPALFPLVGRPVLRESTGGDFRALLGAPGTAVVSRGLFEELGGELGRTLSVVSGGDGRSFEVRIAGVLEKDNAIGQGETILFSLDTYRRASTQPFGFSAIYAVTPDDTRADEAEKFIGERLPLARTQTAPALLRQLEEQVELINRFLVIVGLLALLIGGVGIVNTMQVLLARRKLEIAMLKTTGYQRRDLFLLFGLEAALLGLLGGVIGAAVGIGVAALIRTLFERAFQLTLVFRLDPGIIAGGVAVGLATALIFGLLPIVRAAGVRPQAVIRELPEGRSWRGAVGSVGLVLLLSLLFAVLAITIIGSVQWGLAAVYGAFAFLGLLSLFFGLVVVVIGRLPVPERYSLPYLLLVTGAFALALALAVLVPDLRGIGILLAIATGLGYVIVLLPREWKINTKMAFRNVGRARGRVTTTLLALFIGVFAVGLVLVLGQGIRETVNGFIAQQIRYNVIALAPRPQLEAFNRALDAAGRDVKARQTNEVAIGTQPAAVNGGPIGPLVERARTTTYDGPPADVLIGYLSGLQGHDLAAGQAPSITEITAGRGLGPADAGTNNVIVDYTLNQEPLKLQPGDTLTQSNQFTGQRQTLTIVGFYKSSGTGISINLNVAPVLGSLEAARALGGPGVQTVYYLQIEPSRAAAVTEALNGAVPGALVFNLGDLLAQFGQVINNLLLMLTAIASLALIAGIIIIANAVALAMLERRRELGILKSVGYTSGRVLSVVLIENGLIGGVGGLLGMLLVAVATAVFARQANTVLDVSPVTTIGLIGLVAVVAMLVAAFVAWGATRVRPLEVLRYE